MKVYELIEILMKIPAGYDVKVVVEDHSHSKSEGALEVQKVCISDDDKKISLISD